MDLPTASVLTWAGVVIATGLVFLRPVPGVRPLRWATGAAWALLLWGLLSPVFEPDFENRAEDAYVATWSGLDRAADALAERIREAGEGPGETSRLDFFQALERHGRILDGPHLGENGATALLFDAYGEAVAWQGPGLLHEPQLYELPKNGKAWHQADTAVSLWTVRSLEVPADWRLVVGLSLPLRPFPFASTEESVSWVPAPPPAAVPDGVEVLGRDGERPVLWIERSASPPPAPAVRQRADSPSPSLWAGLVAWIVCGIWGAARGVSAGPTADALGAGAAGAWGAAAVFGAVPWASGLGAAAFALWLLVISRELRRPPRAGGGELNGAGSAWVPALLGPAGFLVLLGISRALQARLGPLDLSGAAALSVDGAVLRAAAGVSVLALFLALPRCGPAGAAVLPVALLLWGSAAAAHDLPAFALPLGALGALCFARWWAGASRRSPALLAVVALGAACFAGLAWQTAERETLRRQAEEVYLPLVVPPEDDDLNNLLLDLQAHFEAWKPEASRLSGTADAPSSSREDLAFRLWLGSPLPHRDGLSALVVEDLEGRRSSFSFGLPLGDDGEPLPRVGRLRVPQTRAWTDRIYGEAEVGRPETAKGEILDSDEPWGHIRYWFLPRPGFRIDAVDEIRELARTLVREKPRGDTADGLPRGLEYVYFGPMGRALATPWETLSPLPPELLRDLPPRARLTTPEGPAWCWLREDDEGVTALLLPILDPREGLERIGFVALTMFPLLVVLAWAIWWVPSTWPGLREILRDALRSYSKRLILVYTVLLLVPLVALNLVLLRSFSERLQQEQLQDAQRAMVSARALLVDFLNGLEPGFSIDTQVNRELLEWISDLVQHQVSVYWGSRIYRSSQEELFTAGLLPRRIPGEIFTRLTLLGHDMGFRRQRTGDLAYWEVYAPLDVPGVVSSQQELFVSVPLLEQEEAAERRLAELQRRALLVTSALFALLLAVGSRLTRGFTRPIVELIAGTERIARGESFPDIRPRETELSALAEAIGTMSRQVDESRRGLMREKQFVERVVAHITSAVVSLDQEHRVAFQNQVAAELLGTRVGDSLAERLGAEAHLGPLWDLWQEIAGGDPETQRVAQLKLRPAGETVDVREWNVTWVPIPGGGDLAGLLVVDDDTEVLRGQRLEAWAEMARIIAHEIKNPLTPIQLSAEHLRQVHRSNPERLDEIVDRCTDNILSNVEELRSIASEFSIYSRIPAAQLEVADLGAAMEELAASYRDVAERGVTFETVPPELPVSARFDEKLLGRAVRNLLENAYRAAAPTGGRVELAVRREPGPPAVAVVEVSDSGPGVDPNKLHRIFEPYFSTYETGTGLGLAIVRRIVDEHGGEVEARNRPGGGLSVVIRIPLNAPTVSEVPSSATADS